MLLGLPFLVAAANDATAGVNAPLRRDGSPAVSEAELQAKKAAWATFHEKDFTTTALPPCPGSPATLGAGSTSANLNQLLSEWETADATAACSGVLTFTAPTATTYTLSKCYGIYGGSSWVLDASPSGGVTLVAAANNRHVEFYQGALAVQGLTFTGGDTTSYQRTTDGGSINVSETILRVISCVFDGNVSPDGGGAIYSESGQVLIAATTFHANLGVNGGALQLVTLAGTSNNTIVDSTFRGNVASGVSDQGPTRHCATNGFLGQAGGGLESGERGKC